MLKQENRKHKRVSVKLKVDYRNVDDFLSSFATNLSEGGIFIKTKDISPVGSKVDIKFLLPKTKKTIKAKGIVTWANSSDHRGDDYIGMGLEFKNLSEEDKKIIKEVVEQLVIK